MSVKLPSYRFSGHWSPNRDTPLTRCKVQARCGPCVPSRHQGKSIISFVWFPKQYFQLILCLASCPLGFLCFIEFALRAKWWVLVGGFLLLLFFVFNKTCSITFLRKTSLSPLIGCLAEEGLLSACLSSWKSWSAMKMTPGSNGLSTETWQSGGGLTETGWF